MACELHVRRCYDGSADKGIESREGQGISSLWSLVVEINILFLAYLTNSSPFSSPALTTSQLDHLILYC